MIPFLLVVLIVILLVRWVVIRDPLAEIERHLEELSAERKRAAKPPPAHVPVTPVAVWPILRCPPR
jgi:hypothetical protein